MWRPEKDSKCFSKVTTVCHWHGLKRHFSIGTPQWHAPPQLPGSKIFLFSIPPHTTREQRKAGAVAGTRGICECLGVTVGIEPVWAMSVRQQAPREPLGSLLPRTLTRVWFYTCEQSSKPNLSGHLLRNHTVKLLMEKEGKLSVTCDWHSCQRSHQISNN